jgi:putative peptidoglycan lipid II flippase
MSLIAYGSGLPAFVLIKVLAPGFYARQDTKTPLRIGMIAVLVNMVLNMIIVFPWKHLGIPGPHAGLAVGTSLAAYLNASLLYRNLHQQNVYRARAGWQGLGLRVIAASIIMSALLSAATPSLAQWGAWPALQRGMLLGGLVALGIVSYLLILLMLGVRPRQFVVD